MKTKLDAKVRMLEHSKAKVELYGKYLSIYLNILSRVNSVTRIYLFDLLCGEGIYEDGSKGSPLVALQAIKDHYFSHAQSCPNISVWLNDNGLSKIEKGVPKIERVKRLCAECFVPSKVELKFFQDDYGNILPLALNAIKESRGTKGLFFVDPYGYKSIRPADVKSLLESGQTEVLLFLPISHMYRFAETSLHSSFPGSEPLYDFLTELYGTTTIRFNSVYDFIDQSKEQFKRYLGNRNIFVDTFTLERDRQNVYGLFFFTSHTRGFEKMLETKWTLDSEQGRGFKLRRNAPLFTGVEISGYPAELANFLSGSQYRTNHELYSFGLQHGFLPKHTVEILKDWKQQHKVDVISLDGRPARGFYIEYKPDREIGISLKD